MDDESFKKEVLNRLDQIIELLSATLPEACLEEPVEGEGVAEPVLVAATPTYLIDDEMRDGYRSAVQKWQQDKEVS